MTIAQVLAERPLTAPTPNGAAPPPVADVSQHGVAARAPRASKTPRAADWKVSEAPASCCLKWRIGTLEVLYTARGATDAEIQPRITALLPWLQAPRQPGAWTARTGRLPQTGATGANGMDAGFVGQGGGLDDTGQRP